ncbi:MAG: S-layer homology domain-containing protein [Candidatus Gracilibacteria bacterium]|nr:S-layer homology domain-containing protein [Candidatus Gracilibacteria bacterium]
MKKNDKKMAKKNTPKMAEPQKNERIEKLLKNNLFFGGLMAFFAGFSLYAVFSFFVSTGSYIDERYASVLHEGEGSQVEEVDLSYDVFIDVKSNMPNAFAIEKLRDLGIFGGYKDGSFKPNKIITRAEILSVLTTAMDVDFAGSSFGDCFTDVKNEWFAVPVCYAKKQGWVSGLDDGSFGPRGSVKYPEALKTIIMAFEFEVPAKVEVDPISGVKIDDWSAPYFKSAIDYGLIDHDFVLDNSYKLTRGDFAELVYRSMKVKKLF